MISNNEYKILGVNADDDSSVIKLALRNWHLSIIQIRTRIALSQIDICKIKSAYENIMESKKMNNTDYHIPVMKHEAVSTYFLIETDIC